MSRKLEVSLHKLATSEGERRVREVQHDMQACRGGGRTGADCCLYVSSRVSECDWEVGEFCPLFFRDHPSLICRESLL